jgi:hypothetical protein
VLQSHIEVVECQQSEHERDFYEVLFLEIKGIFMFKFIPLVQVEILDLSQTKLNHASKYFLA